MSIFFDQKLQISILKSSFSNISKMFDENDDENFDFAITGEAEFAFVKFVNAIVNNEETKLIPGLIKKIGEKKK